MLISNCPRCHRLHNLNAVEADAKDAWIISGIRWRGAERISAPLCGRCAGALKFRGKCERLSSYVANSDVVDGGIIVTKL